MAHSVNPQVIFKDNSFSSPSNTSWDVGHRPQYLYVYKGGVIKDMTQTVTSVSSIRRCSGFMVDSVQTLPGTKKSRLRLFIRNIN